MGREQGAPAGGEGRAGGRQEVRGAAGRRDACADCSSWPAANSTRGQNRRDWGQRQGPLLVTCAGNGLGVLVPSVPPHGPWDPRSITQPPHASSPLGFPSSALLPRHLFSSYFLSSVAKIISASKPPCSLRFHPYPHPGG